MAKPVVSIVKGTDAQQMVEQALQLMGDVESLIKPGSTVVIKPNAGHPSAPDTSVNTSPEIVSAAIKAIRGYGAKKIIMAEAAAVGQDTLKGFEVSGQRKAAEEAGIDEIIDIKRLPKEALTEIEVPNSKAISKFTLPKLLLEADCVVGLPIFKTHLSMVYTGAVKAMKGVVDDRMHRRMHFVDLSEALMDLKTVTMPTLTIVDMIRPMEGLGPMTLGKPTEFGCVVAGRDCVAIDAVCCKMTGIDANGTYLVKGAERNLGVMDVDQIDIRGNTIEEVYKKLDTPFLQGFARYPEYKIYDENACSSCMGIMAYVFEALKTQGKYDENAGISVVFGAKKTLPTDVRGKDLILVGKCLEKHRDKGVCCGGCPPMAFGPIFGILKREDQEEEQAPIDAWKADDAKDWLAETEGKRH